MKDEVPADTGSADPGSELRLAAKTVRERYRKGSPAYQFWRVTAGIWERWAERMELGVELSPVAHAEFQAALFSARKYLEMHHVGSGAVQITAPVTCARCGHVYVTEEEGGISATELSARLLSHSCDRAEHGTG
jgi:hypothetical protein